MYKGITNSLKKLNKSYIFNNNFNIKQCKSNIYFSSEKRKKNLNDFELIKKKLPHAIVSKYEPILDDSMLEVLDVEKERNEVKEETFYNEFDGINFQRGIKGVFEIEEIVSILKKEKAENIFVVKIPPEYRYADFMIIVSARSIRHSSSILEFLLKIYKKKKNSTDIIPKIEGKNSSDWKALDLGNIVLHVLSTKSRQYYDLETLWTVGKEYDSLSLKKKAFNNVIMNYSKALEDLAPNKIAN